MCWTDTVYIIQDAREWQGYFLDTFSSQGVPCSGQPASGSWHCAVYGQLMEIQSHPEVIQRARGAAFPASLSCSCSGYDRGTVHIICGCPVCVPAGDDYLQMHEFCDVLWIVCFNPDVLCKDCWCFYVLCVFLLVIVRPRSKTGLGNQRDYLSQSQLSRSSRCKVIKDFSLECWELLLLLFFLSLSVW